MTFKPRLLLCVLSTLLSAPLMAAPLKVVTTLPDLAEIARDIGGPEVDVSSLLTGTEDPHFLDASPAFVMKVARADLVCAIGLELEVGWLPKVLSKSGNSAVQPGGKGFCETGAGVDVIEKPAQAVDRSMGDVHRFGNPHFVLSPKALAEAAVIVKERLVQLRPGKSETFEKNLKGFRERMTKLQKGVAEKLKPVLTKTVIEYHKEFSYFFHVYGLKSLGSIEEKPGVPPSAARLASVAQEAKAAHVQIALGSLHSPEKHLQRFQELSGVPYKRVPCAVVANDPQWNSIEKVQNGLAQTLVDALK